ncbi:MAG: response regulator [Candidatus Sulfotelmatobacter sp.]
MARKILLADDSVTAQNMGRKILSDAGYEVVTVNNGSAALKKIAELKPDLVILDVYMPGYSGLEVCQRLKESQDSARIPVLLTVGKLEPFKPEEANRVRAEGFIVKPFEASELLAALSKLEDKVVPRSEPSKPGRFARAIAAAEESGRISRNDSADDNGWKNRISFPQDKTADEKAIEEPPIYNPVNRDLRTVVEAPAEKAPQNRRSTDKKPDDTPKQDQPQEVRPQTADPTVDVAALASAGLPKDVTPEEVAAIAAAAAQIQMAGAVVKEQSSDAEASALAAAPNLQTQDAQAQDIPAQPVPQNVTTEITLEAKDKSPSDNVTPDIQVRPADEPSGESQDVPITMAVASGSAAPAEHGNASRWSAVAVALDAEEGGISLEHEMQKAYAAFVAEEKFSANALASPEIASQENSSAAPVQVVEDSSLHAPAISEPEPQLESSAHSENFASAETSQPAPLQDAQNAPSPDSFVVPEPPSVPEPPTSIASPEPALAAPATLEPLQDATPESSSASAAPLAEAVAEPTNASAPAALISQDLPPAPEPALAGTPVSRHPYAPIIHAKQVPEQPAQEVRSKDDKEEPKENSEPVDVKSTAAAWASWRQIRDTDAKAAPAPLAPQESPASAPSVDSAAMAVAAGAEQRAQEPNPENPADVASIVDSVLADLRPRLMAEITRKMAEKK